MLIGVQFNQNVYAAITTDAPNEQIADPDESFSDMEQKVLVLAPQFVRVFFNATQARQGPDSTRDSFVRAVKLAQRAGATINITLQSAAPYLATPDAGMAEFAELLDELVTTHGASNLRWVTLQNEPNTTKHIVPPVLNEMYRKLDLLLVDKSLRHADRTLPQQIRFMGGDLVHGSPLLKGDAGDPPLPADTDEAYWDSHRNEKYWLTWMAENMADIIDAYSIHIYWHVVNDVGQNPQNVKFWTRLEGVLGEPGGIVPRMAARKPVFVTEYGVRGDRPPGVDGPGTFTDGEPIEQSRVAAFQHAWFQILAARYGCAGTIKWDCFYGMYDRRPQSYYAIGKATDGWPLYPMYFVLWLFTNATEPGWRVVEAVQAHPSRGTSPQLVAFEGQTSERTIFGLDSRGATLNAVSSTQVSYTIPTGLPRVRFSLIVWNRDGGGGLVREPDVTADGSGSATLIVPLHAVFALTTKAMTLPSGEVAGRASEVSGALEHGTSERHGLAGALRSLLGRR